MTKSLIEVIIVRRQFTADALNKQLQLVEYDGTRTLLSLEPKIIINEVSNVNLTDFLKNTIEVGSFVSISFERVNSIEDLFDTETIIATEPKNITGNITLENDELFIDGKSLYDEFWRYLKGYATTYVYMEISVQK